MENGTIEEEEKLSASRADKPLGNFEATPLPLPVNKRLNACVELLGVLELNTEV